jgi:hypothetical protein
MEGKAIDFVEVMKNLGQLFNINELVAFSEKQVKDGGRIALKYDDGEISVDIVYDEPFHRVVLGCQVFTLPKDYTELLELYQVFLASNVYWSGTQGQGITIGVLPDEKEVFLCKHYALPFFDLANLKQEIDGFGQCCRTWRQALEAIVQSN